jgi:hypothetical protein
MSLDLRIPLGLMFILIGAITGVFGFFTRGSAMYQRSAGMNINLIWGLIMLAFGLMMYLLGRNGAVKTAQSPPSKPVQGTNRPHGH